jgi:hypothetical protein
MNNSESLTMNLKFTGKTFLQALTLGIVVVILGILFFYVFEIFGLDTMQQYEKMRPSYILEMILFLVGFSLSYILQNEQVRKYVG